MICSALGLSREIIPARPGWFRAEHLMERISAHVTIDQQNLTVLAWQPEAHREIGRDETLSFRGRPLLRGSTSSDERLVLHRRVTAGCGTVRWQTSFEQGRQPCDRWIPWTPWNSTKIQPTQESWSGTSVSKTVSLRGVRRKVVFHTRLLLEQVSCRDFPEEYAAHSLGVLDFLSDSAF